MEFVNGVSTSPRVLLVKYPRLIDSQTTTSRILHLSKSHLAASELQMQAFQPFQRQNFRRVVGTYLVKIQQAGANDSGPVSGLSSTLTGSSPASYLVRGVSRRGLAACYRCLLKADGQPKSPLGPCGLGGPFK